MKRLVNTLLNFIAVNTLIAMMTLLVPGLAFADACIQDNYQASDPKLANKTLGCTANDIQVAEVTEITPLSGIYVDGDKLYCFTGSDIEFNANFEVVLTAQDRYDIGLYLSADGTDALTGDCNSTVITSENNSSDNYINEDPAPDACGDITGPIGSLYNPQKVNMTVEAVCQGNGSVQIEIGQHAIAIKDDRPEARRTHRVSIPRLLNTTRVDRRKVQRPFLIAC